MPTNYSGRLTVILLVLLGSLWALFPRFDFSRPDLKPGIDMVGGTKLIYEIKPPEGGRTSDMLAEEVATSLKRRVDPQGLLNLIWRPQGGTRLEIQMPLSRSAADSAPKRQAFAAAQEELEATNVRSATVLRAVEKLTGDDRRKRFEELAMGSETRATLFGALASVFDRIQTAKTEQNAAAQAEAELEYEKLKSQIDETNLTAAEMEQVLTLKETDRDKRLAELKKQFANFPERVVAIDQFQKAFADFQTVRGTLDSAADLKRNLRGSGLLEFYIVVTDRTSADAQAMIDRLNKRGPQVQAGDTMRWLEADRPGELAGMTVPYNDKEWLLVYTTPDKSLTKGPGQAAWELESASSIQTELGVSVVSFTFDAQGARYFSDLTGGNIGQPMAIALDEKVISAPNINARIGRSGQIDGGSDGFSRQELDYLVRTLNAGSLPAQLADEPISEQTVGPQLGEDNLRRGLYSCYFGLVVVAIFLIGYYYLSGVVAMIAVLLNLVIILGVMAMLNATFTLPSIAGIVLTIGMAVDANVLIFERLREEQQRGLSLQMALRNSYDRAFSAIVDGNITTGITAACLYAFGSEEVKGFGLTLLIGIVSSLFTALFVTRTIFGLLIDKLEIKKLGSLPLSVPAWDKMLRPNIDWMGKAWIAYTFSIVFMTVGLIAFCVKLAQGQMMDIEFASGTSVQVELKQPMEIEEVRTLIEEGSEQTPDALPAPQVQSVGTDDLTYEVVTPNVDATKVRAAVVSALGDKMKIEVPSTFEGTRQPEEAVQGQFVFPIENAEQQFAGFTPAELPEYVGGAAIVLNHLTPPIAPKEIEERIERARLQPQPGQTAPPYREFTVVSESGNPNEPTTTAVVLVTDPEFTYAADEARWREQVAAPFWRLVNDAVNSEANLTRVANFNSQVAKETQTDALVALTLSILVIMAYIWVRFGNLKYGTATVVALLHDTLFVLAAIGIAHYVSQFSEPLAKALLLEPFRINLTLVAAVLTVMGYSMNDTVVVFDRIRENRGKYGHVDRQIVNDSINQTLSRTLLTGGTTILTILVMYVFGGPGVHGFTFALLIGILVGTYSSIAIASPILLIGGAPEERASDAKKQPAGQLQRA